MIVRGYVISIYFFFNGTATTEIYTLSLHDALPICLSRLEYNPSLTTNYRQLREAHNAEAYIAGELHTSQTNTITNAIDRSEEHTSELQSHVNLVCRLLLEKKKKKNTKIQIRHQTSK